MTDLPSSLNPQTAPFVDPVAHTTPSLIQADEASTAVPYVDEYAEDYTIKCICAYKDDDGNTVLCERCDTWQHIECYYSSKKVPEVHNCTDCEPRQIDARSATVRQRRKREQMDTGDRRSKKPSTKSHKKKIKAPEASVNGWPVDKHEHASSLDHSNRSSRDQPPPTKRPKTSHRASSSMSQVQLSNVAAQTGKRSVSSSHALQSPSKTPTSNSPGGYCSEIFSLEFLQLYDHDPGDVPMQANLFDNIKITNDLSLWSEDVESLAQATNGRLHQDIFQRCDQPLGSMTFPELRPETKEDHNTSNGGPHPTWKFLVGESSIPQSAIIGELRGKIGHMNDYCQDPANRWAYLRHPVPFVFFHPHLPIYIDTRSEGTLCRYLRRSCRPNVFMKTILENGSDYHFCFVSNQNIEAGTELTIGWVLDENIRKCLDRAHFGYNNNEEIKQEGVSDTEADYISDWVGKVLADFGGCACDNPSQCSLARFDRRNSTSSIDSAICLSNGKSKRGRKPHNNNNNISPKSTGRATNSRAGSERLKHSEDPEQDDSRSSSGSMRSKPPSRDMTPADHVPGEPSVAVGFELSSREQRKIAALEKNFELLEQDKHQPPVKKRKRGSGASNLNTPAASSSKQLGHTASSFSQPNTSSVTSRPRYTDASTTHQQPGSPACRSPQPPAMPNFSANSPKRSPQPHTPFVASPLTRPQYVSRAMQTDCDENDDWYHSLTLSATTPKPYISLTKRLLIRSHTDRVRLEERMRAEVVSSSHIVSQPLCDQPDTSGMMDTNGGMEPDSAPAQQTHEDVEMQEAHLDYERPSGVPSSNLPVERLRPPDTPPITSDNPPHSNFFKPPPPPWPTSNNALPPNGYRVADMRVQLPPTPSFSTNPASILVAPNSFSSSLAQSPSSRSSNSYPPLASSLSAPSIVQPSPVKKKLSLGDYMSRRSNHKVETPGTVGDRMGSSPTMSQSLLKPLGEETKGNEIGEATIVETPVREDGEFSEENKDPKP
ncbi:MAG: hypothetical protein FRX48_01465 [Lasallia pustulata]|uniref:SET domain-containing protein n=1 Tax=Lasallia pustulata TaxID=136370 RepID=A0A5M8Q020_9LECA|nr:MAG: hypothetical protein FRX48_01465 [Lasallia pustulata]